MSEQAIEPGAQDGVKTAEEVHAETVADPQTPAAQVEVLAETGPEPVKTVAVDLGTGKTVQVPMQSTWRKSAQDYLRLGDFDSWAESVLTEADLGLWDEWMDRDPITSELLDFIERLGKATGEAAGGNRALRRSLQRTPRR